MAQSSKTENINGSVLYLKDPHIWAALAVALLVNAGLLMGGFSLAVKVTWLSLFFLVLVSPVLEEIVFRGLAQSSLMRWRFFQKHWQGITRANVVVSVLFAIAHMWRVSPGFSVLYILPSLVFGFFRDRYNSVLPAIFLHAIYNLFAIVMFY